MRSGQSQASLYQSWFKRTSYQRSSFYVFIFILTIFNFFVLFSINTSQSLRRKSWLSLWRSDEPLSEYDAVGILNIVLTNASGELKDGKISMDVLSKVLTKIKNDAYAMEQRDMSQDTEDVISEVIETIMPEEPRQELPREMFMKLRKETPQIEDFSSKSSQDTFDQTTETATELQTRATKRKETQKNIEQQEKKLKEDIKQQEKKLKEDIKQQETKLKKDDKQQEKKLKSCVEDHELLVGPIKTNMTALKEQELVNLFPYVRKGGTFTPTTCRPKEKTAIIFPFRNRKTHLHILLLNLIPILRRQMIDFTIFIIDQVLPGSFNRGMLLNVGFLEALKMDHYDCFIFHDVDLLPINDKNFYHCNDAPTHFLSGVDKYKYKLLYDSMFGGIVGMTKEQFQKVNGCSNLYFGWGGEDDDLHRRVEAAGYTTLRKYQDIGLYDMIKHHRDDENEANPVRKLILKSAVKRMHVEGLNTTVYTSLGTTQLPMYTRVSVRLNLTLVDQTAPAYLSQILDIRQKKETSK